MKSITGYLQLKSGHATCLFLMLGLSIPLFIFGCNRPFDPSTPGQEKMMTEEGTKSNFSTKGEFFLVDIADATEIIPRSDPRFKAIQRLLEIGENSKHFPATNLGGYSLAPVFSIAVLTPRESSTPIDGLTHYLEHMIWTERYGLRALPDKTHKEMLDLWDSIRATPKNGTSLGTQKD